jgi:hypothetical protein
MTNPCPSKKCDSKWVPHPPTRLSSAGVDDSGPRICGTGDRGDFSQTNRENDLSSSTKISRAFALGRLLSERIKLMRKLPVPSLFLHRRGIPEYSESCAGGWIVFHYENPVRHLLRLSVTPVSVDQTT